MEMRNENSGFSGVSKNTLIQDLTANSTAREEYILNDNLTKIAIKNSKLNNSKVITNFIYANKVLPKKPLTKGSTAIPLYIQDEELLRDIKNNYILLMEIYEFKRVLKHYLSNILIYCKTATDFFILLPDNIENYLFTNTHLKKCITENTKSEIYTLNTKIKKELLYENKNMVTKINKYIFSRNIF